MHKSVIPSISEPVAHSVIVPNSAIIFAHRVNSEFTSGQKSHDSLRLPSFDARSNSISRNEDLRHNCRSVASIDQGASAQSSKSDTSSHLLSGGNMSFEKMVNSPMHEFSPPLPPFRRKSDSDAPVRSPPGIFLSPSSTPVSPNSPGNLKKESKVVDDEELKFCSPNSPDSNATTSPESVLSPMSSDSPLPPATPVSSPPSYLPTSPEGPSRQGGDDENYIRVRPHLASPPSGQGSPCMICGDKSTGKHYGAHSCDGCKGFFRRSIRKCHNYSCRFDRTCNVTKDRRNQCRYCRLHKCLEVGMKKEAVQNERDRISQRRTPASSCPPTPQPQSPPQPERGGGITVEILLKAEEVFKQINEKRLEEMQSELTKKGLMIESARGAAGFVPPFSHCDVASLEDVAESVKQQLYGLVDFARAIPQFNALNLEDKIKLLKAHSGEHLLLGIAWRSLSTDGFLVLGINKLIPRLETGVTVPHGRLNNTTADQSTSISWIASRVLDDIVGPLRQHKVNALEFLCLRTMIFFDPMLHGLVDRNSIQQSRLEVQLLLEDLISKRPDVPARGRLGQIMFILPYLQTISGAMTQQIQLVKKDGVQSIDQIIPEMLLGCFPEDEREEGHESLTSPIMTMIPPPPSRSRARDFENERRPSGSLDRRSMRSPASMEPCDLSYHPQQQDVINYSSDPREQNLSDVHNQPTTHIQQNGYSRLPHARDPDHDQNHIREYYVRDQQPFMNEDVCQAQDLAGSNKNGSMSGVNGSYRMDHINDYSNPKMYALRGAENLTAIEVSRDYVDQDQWRLPSSALIDLSNSNAQNGVLGNRNSQSPLESMEHSSLECMDTTPLDCSDRNHSQRMRDAFVDHRPPSLTQGRDQLIHHTSKVLSNGLLTQNNGLSLDRNSSHILGKESNFRVGSDDHSMLRSTLESSEEVRGVVVMGPVRVDHYGSFETCNHHLVRVRDASRSVDCSSPRLPLNLRQRLSER